MIYIDNTDIEQYNNTVVTIGNFDGIHLGHMALIDKLKECANKNNLKSVIFSFYPHPKYVVTGFDVQHIFSRNEKFFILDNLNIDVFIEYPFNLEFAQTSPKYFIEQILVKKLKCKMLIVGEDYRFGNSKLGDINFIKKIANKLNIGVIVVPHYMYDNKKVSSTNIRKLISEGNIYGAEKILNRNFFIKGTVIKGKQLGRTIGFPTANILPNKNKILPPFGAYITKTMISKTNDTYESITNIGVNPTVDGKIKIVETFLFNFEGNLYGKDIIVCFLIRLRGEKKFRTLGELKKQIEKDVNIAKNYLQITQ